MLVDTCNKVVNIIRAYCCLYVLQQTRRVASKFRTLIITNDVIETLSAII